MVSRAGAFAQHRKLAFIDAHRAIFAGMIHPDHGLGVGRRAGRFGSGFTRHVSAIRAKAQLSTSQSAQRRDQEGEEAL